MHFDSSILQPPKNDEYTNPALCTWLAQNKNMNHKIAMRFLDISSPFEMMRHIFIKRKNACQ
jgi:hypothetical protein